MRSFVYMLDFIILRNNRKQIDFFHKSCPLLRVRALCLLLVFYNLRMTVRCLRPLLVFLYLNELYTVSVLALKATYPVLTKLRNPQIVPIFMQERKNVCAFVIITMTNFSCGMSIS